MEIWKDIRGYEGLYQVSNLGRVKSVARRVCNHPSGSTRQMQEHFITPTDNGNGYKIVGLRSDHKRQNKYVHRLVAEHFLENPQGKNYVNHIDFDKSNNRASNLEWCSQKENVQHSSSHMRHPKSVCKTSNTGEKYISARKDRRQNIRYRVFIVSERKERSFGTLAEAIQYRNEVMQKWQSQ